LGKFRPDQQPLVESALNDAAEAAACWCTQGLTAAMNRFNRKANAAADA